MKVVLEKIFLNYYLNGRTLYFILLYLYVKDMLYKVKFLRYNDWLIQTCCMCGMLSGDSIALFMKVCYIWTEQSVHFTWLTILSAILFLEQEFQIHCFTWISNSYFLECQEILSSSRVNPRRPSISFICFSACISDTQTHWEHNCDC